VLYLDGGFGLLVFGLWLFCLIDVITTDEWRCRNLPKIWWVLIVLLLFDVGAVVWLVAGRPWPGQELGGRRGSSYAEYDRPGRFVAGNPDDDEEFLRQCRERAEEQRRRYRERQRKDDEQG
jgi:hypothetical protein